MADQNINPSVVKDSSGSNYGGISSNPVENAQLEYLKGLWDRVQKPMTAPLTTAQEFPTLDRGIQVGSLSSQTLGSVPIFGVGGGVVSMAAMDAMRKAKQEAEINYYKQLAVDPKAFELDVALTDIKMSNEWNQKKIDLANEMYDKILPLFDGESDAGQKAAKYLSVSPDWKRTMKQMDHMGNMIEASRAKIMEVIAAHANPDVAYASDEMYGRAQDFLKKLETLDERSIQEVYDATESFQTHASLYTVVKKHMSSFGKKTQTILSKASNMDTNTRKAYIKSEITGATEEDIENIYKNVLYENPWVKGDKEAEDFIRREVKNQADYEYKKTLELVDQKEAETEKNLRALGLNVDEYGKPSFGTIATPIPGKTGQAAISYGRQTSGKPYSIGLQNGAEGYIRRNNITYRVRIEDPGDVELNSEYTLTGADSGVDAGRYIQGTFIASPKEIYESPREMRNITTRKGTETQFIDDPDKPKLSEQVRAIEAWDLSTNTKHTFYGPQTILLSWDDYQTAVSGSVPGLSDAHRELPYGATNVAGPVVLDHTNPNQEIINGAPYIMDGELYVGTADGGIRKIIK